MPLVRDMRSSLLLVPAHLLCLLCLPVIVACIVILSVILVAAEFIERHDPMSWNQAVLLAFSVTVLFALALFGNFAL